MKKKPGIEVHEVIQVPIDDIVMADRNSPIMHCDTLREAINLLVTANHPDAYHKALTDSVVGGLVDIHNMIADFVEEPLRPLMKEFLERSLQGKAGVIDTPKTKG